jgi:hypothetical protein
MLRASGKAMGWVFDQTPDTACITCRSVVEGAAVLSVTHYDEDDSWAFLDGQPYDMRTALVVAMQTVISVHPSLTDIADLPPGWSAVRGAVGQPWIRTVDVWDKRED